MAQPLNFGNWQMGKIPMPTFNDIPLPPPSVPGMPGPMSGNWLGGGGVDPIAALEAYAMQGGQFPFTNPLSMIYDAFGEGARTQAGAVGIPEPGAPAPAAPPVDPNAPLFSVPYPLDQMPKPPMLPAPPQIGAPVGPDFSVARGLLEEAAPQAADPEALQAILKSGILSGLAGGAGQVDPTEAGAFAKALALAGAGGSGAAAKGQAYKMETELSRADKASAHKATMADFEMGAENAKVAQENAAAEISYKNAALAYETAQKNAAMDYEFKGKQFEMMLPNISVSDGTAVVQQFNKDKGTYEVRAVPLQDTMSDLGNVKKFIDAVGADSTAGRVMTESLELQHIVNRFKNDPVALNLNTRRLILDKIVDNGSGSAVFGAEYEKAMEMAKAQVPFGDGGEEYRAELKKAITNILMNHPAIMQSDNWIKDAAKFGSVAAGIVAGQ